MRSLTPCADKANKNTWIFMSRSKALDRHRFIVLIGHFFLTRETPLPKLQKKMEKK